MSNLKWVGTVETDVAKVIWLIVAAWCAATGKVNPWLVLLLATMDFKLALRWGKR